MSDKKQKWQSDEYFKDGYTNPHITREKGTISLSWTSGPSSYGAFSDAILLHKMQKDGFRLLSAIATGEGYNSLVLTFQHPKRKKAKKPKVTIPTNE